MNWSDAATNAVARIERKTTGELQAFANSMGLSRSHESVRALGEVIAHEYGNRFLIELIQNAHDAHPSGRRDGRIAVLLNVNEGDHGVLYVANGGTPFSIDNFEAICDIGLSSKPVGEGIGNKGLGFRSVLQICGWPEIHSADPSTGRWGDPGAFVFGFPDEQAVLKICSVEFADRPEVGPAAIVSRSRARAE